MASNTALPEDDLTCAVCMDIFTDPVGLKCSHVFCKACLLKCWEENRARECPMCREKTTEDPSGNRVLKNLCESFLKHRINKTASTSESLCDLHGEKLKLFCLSDEEPICSICQTSERHESHKLRPIQEAALKYKETVEKALKPLKEKLEAFTEEKQKSDQEAQLIKDQAESTVKQIEEEFEKLHQFLQDEKTAKLTALREEEEEKSQRMKERVEEMTKEISSLSDTIRALEQDMKADDFSFLQNYKATKSRALYEVSDPEKVSGGRIDVATHLGNLKYRVWKKMKRIVKYTPVILDPNTKGENLTLSGDLTSLRYSGETELSSDDDDDDDDDDDIDEDDDDNDENDDDDDDNDDNDDDDSDDEDDDEDDDDEDDDDDDTEDDDGFKDDIVFGSKGFTGKHCWDVEVGDSSNWALGVAEKASDDGEPKWGEMWGICYSDGEYGVMSRSGNRTNTKLNVWRDVRRVRMRLDWDRDRLSFSDPTSNTSLHTFKHVFADPLFPWFGVSSDCVALRICPVKVSVKVG